MRVVFGSVTVANIVQVLALELVLDRIGGEAGLGAVSGAGWGALLGVAAAGAMLGHRIFGGHGFRVWLIEAGNDVLNWTIAGAILSAMR
jgi:hypothetical protein